MTTLIQKDTNDNLQIDVMVINLTGKSAVDIYAESFNAADKVRTIAKYSTDLLSSSDSIVQQLLLLFDSGYVIERMRIILGEYRDSDSGEIMHDNIYTELIYGAVLSYCIIRKIPLKLE